MRVVYQLLWRNNTLKAVKKGSEIVVEEWDGKKWNLTYAFPYTPELAEELLHSL